MSAHTPGPWRWCGNYLLQDCPRCDGKEGKEDNPYSTPCGRPIADDGSAGDEYSPAIDITGPDARLIASAPELLAAAKNFVRWVDACWGTTKILPPESMNEYESAKAAIRKATEVA